MRRAKLFCGGLAINLGLVTVLPSTFAGCGGRDVTAIQHTVFIVKENHTFDNYFGTFAGADGSTSGATSDGHILPLNPMPDAYQANDLCNSWDCAIEAIDGGKMDQFDLISGGNLDAYVHASEQDIPNYWAYAHRFALADQYFTSVHGPSFPNHLFSVAAQSDGVIANEENSGSGVACDGTPSGTVTTIDANGKMTQVSPCFDFPTLGDSLQQNGLTWKYYADGGGGVFNNIRHIRNGPAWKNNLASTAQFFADAQAGKLPVMSWLLPSYENSEHPPNSICEGENWTVTVLNAVMQGPDWSSTAVFITWDDFGGLYDHVPPHQLDQFGLGPRVPLLIISPFAKTGYISHNVHEHSSILKLAETRYGLQPLTARDRAASNMLDSFDFNQQPQPPLSCVHASASETPTLISHLDFQQTEPHERCAYSKYSPDRDPLVASAVGCADREA